MLQRRSSDEQIERKLKQRLNSIPHYLREYPRYCHKCDIQEYCDEHLTGEDIVEQEMFVYYDLYLSQGAPTEYFRIYLTGAIESNEEIDRIEYYYSVNGIDFSQIELAGEARSNVEDFIRFQVSMPELY